MSKANKTDKPKKDAFLIIRIENSIKQKLVVEAGDDGLSELMRRIIEQYFK